MEVHVAGQDPESRGWEQTHILEKWKLSEGLTCIANFASPLYKYHFSHKSFSLPTFFRVFEYVGAAGNFGLGGAYAPSAHFWV